MATALFVCLHNAGRSQMSAALFERAAGDRHRAVSAGTTPADRVHPEVVEVMRELSIDVASRVPRKLTRALAEEADVVVTMGCGDECPYIPGTRDVDAVLVGLGRAPVQLASDRELTRDLPLRPKRGTDPPIPLALPVGAHGARRDDRVRERDSGLRV